jgi:hypothetical protein
MVVKHAGIDPKDVNFIVLLTDVGLLKANTDDLLKRRSTSRSKELSTGLKK